MICITINSTTDNNILMIYCVFVFILFGQHDRVQQQRIHFINIIRYKMLINITNAKMSYP